MAAKLEQKGIAVIVFIVQQKFNFGTELVETNLSFSLDSSIGPIFFYSFLAVEW